MQPGGRGGSGAPHVPPIKIFEKLPHKNAVKHDPPPLIFDPPLEQKMKNKKKKVKKLTISIIL